MTAARNVQPLIRNYEFCARNSAENIGRAESATMTPQRTRGQQVITHKSIYSMNRIGLILATCLPLQQLWSFELQRPSCPGHCGRLPVAVRRHNPPPLLLPRQQQQAQVKDTDVPVNEEPVKQGQRSRQHWLDLRGTAIRPDEALAFFDEFLVYEEDVKTKSKNPSMGNMIDCIIIPEETFQDLPQSVVNSVPLLVVDEESNLVHDGSGEPTGAFVRLGESFLVNPLDSLDMYNRGDWILFDSSAVEPDEMDSWIDQLGSLLQILPATASPQAVATPSGLILPPSRVGKNGDPATKCGGIGICCVTREAVFRVDALLEQVVSSAGATESVDSGILLPYKGEDHGVLPIKSVLILPFDINLWRAVVELRQETR